MHLDVIPTLCACRASDTNGLHMYINSLGPTFEAPLSILRFIDPPKISDGQLALWCSAIFGVQWATIHQ